MTTLVTTRGLPGSGKTTWALNRLTELPPGLIVRVSRDDLRAMMHGGEVFDPFIQAQVTLVEIAAIRAAFTSGAHEVIVDRTNTNPEHLAALRDLANEIGVDFEVKDFSHVTVEECAQRMWIRPTHRQVSEERLWEMYREMTGK